MNNFSEKAKEWDKNPIHKQRSEAIANNLCQRVCLSTSMRALEFGAGTGLLSFILAESLGEIVMMDTAQGMVQVMHEKVAQADLHKLKPVEHDLVEHVFDEKPFDLIFSQMVFHHIKDIHGLLERFYTMLKPGGTLAFADIYTEDGSFHGADFDGHLGFDPNNLKVLLESVGFHSITTEKCFVIQKESTEGVREYPVFQMIAIK